MGRVSGAVCCQRPAWLQGALGLVAEPDGPILPWGFMALSKPGWEHLNSSLPPPWQLGGAHCTPLLSPLLPADVCFHVLCFQAHWELVKV